MNGDHRVTPGPRTATVLHRARRSADRAGTRRAVCADFRVPSHCPVSLRESIDTTTPGGKLVFRVFGALAELERSLILDRAMAGLEAAKPLGR